MNVSLGIRRLYSQCLLGNFTEVIISVVWLIAKDLEALMIFCFSRVGHSLSTKAN